MFCPKIFAVLFFLLFVLTVYILNFCGDLMDADCWRGERVSVVETATLSNNYDPSVAGQTILVYDFAGVRSLKFGSIHNVRQATAVLGDPDIFTIPVLCHMAAAILVLSPAPPRRVLIFGMGGGAIPAFVQKQFPHAHIDIVDLDPQVVRLAFAHFNVRRTPALNVTIADGRRWLDAIPAAGLPVAARYDVVVQDACAGHPCTLVTSAAYAAVASRAMAPGGLFVQNLFSASPRVVATLQDAFDPLLVLDTGYSSKVLAGFANLHAAPPVAAAAARAAAADAPGRARFLAAFGIGQRCYDHGLRAGPTGDAASAFALRFAPGSLPRLAALPIDDSDPDILALETARWAARRAPPPSDR